ncbi:paeninodin family lasso peptide [Exiguobacterium acetylicum]
MKQEWQTPVLEELDAKQTASLGGIPGDDGFGPTTGGS